MIAGMPDRGAFGQRLFDLRSQAGLSQEELSHAAGVSVRALAGMERGRTRGPQRRTVQPSPTGSGSTPPVPRRWSRWPA